MLAPHKAARLRQALGEDADRVSFTDARARYRRPAHAIAELRRQFDLELAARDAELVRLVGEVEFGPTAEEHAGWTRYESLVNRALAGYPAWVICLYDTGALPEKVVADALRTHPFVSTSDGHEASEDFETDDWAEQPLLPAGERARRSGGPIAQLTITAESELDDLRRVVAETARAAGLAPTVVEDVAVAVGELARDGLRHGEGEAAVQIARDGAGWHCEVTDRDSEETGLGRAGLSIARLIAERVELDSEAGAHTVRLTFARAADARQRILDAASELFYQHGIRATGINTIISHSGVAKATFFHHFPAKNDLVVAWLALPASRWFDRIKAELDGNPEPPASRLLAFFDLLGEWFARDDFRGCAFQNAAAETPETAHPVRQATHDYTLEIRRYLRRIASDAGLPNPARTAEELHLLAEGAIATAVATRSPGAAKVARAAAERILS